MSQLTQSKAIALPLGILAAILTYLALQGNAWPWQQATVLAVTVLCAIWWVSEVIPIPATSLIPLAVFPLTGILSRSDVAAAFGNPVNFLLLGGFILSMAMSSSGAHLRIAMTLLRWVKPRNTRQVVLVFMVVSALFSMWISNAATTMILLPVALAILDAAADKERLAVPLLLGICYAANVGGMATPIGTPPNLIFMEIYRQTTGIEISFLRWMQWAIPVVVCLLPLIAWWITRGTSKDEKSVVIAAKERWRPPEVRVLVLFCVTAMLWMTRKDPYGGWSALLNLTDAHDGYIALLAAIAVFILPDGQGGRLLAWEATEKLPWGVIVLVAGGLALTAAMQVTGVTDKLAQMLSGLSGLPLVTLILGVCLFVTFMTELASNSATTALLLPVLASVAIAVDVEPMILMLPAVLSASCAFMLPMATAPNAIVFGSNQVSIQSMMRNGIALNLFCALVITAIVFIRFQ